MLDLSQLGCSFGEVKALDDVNLHVGRDKIVCLLGPSGCGKTTLLRIIAGLVADYRGEVIFEGQDQRQIATHERGFGLMFQDYALFPHMNVADNVAYGLRRRRQSKARIASKVAEMLHRVGLAGFEDRDVSTLSGGEKQRVALARSMAPNPRLLMLDEPLGSLDALLRDQLALELRQTLKSAGLSAIYVTHDHREAYAIADRIAVMDSGTIAQVAAPARLYQFPVNESVARFLGFSNIFGSHDFEVTRRLAAEIGMDPSRGERMLIHPDGIQLRQSLARPAISLRATVEAMVFRGDHSDVQLRLADGMRMTCSSAEGDLQVGLEMPVSIAIDAARRFE